MVKNISDFLSPEQIKLVDSLGLPYELRGSIPRTTIMDTDGHDRSVWDFETMDKRYKDTILHKIWFAEEVLDNPLEEFARGYLFVQADKGVSEGIPVEDFVQDFGLIFKDGTVKMPKRTLKDKGVYIPEKIIKPLTKKEFKRWDVLSRSCSTPEGDLQLPCFYISADSAPLYIDSFHGFFDLNTPTYNPGYRKKQLKEQDEYKKIEEEILKHCRKNLTLDTFANQQFLKYWANLSLCSLKGRLGSYEHQEEKNRRRVQHESKRLEDWNLLTESLNEIAPLLMNYYISILEDHRVN